MEVDVYKVGMYLSTQKDRDSANVFASGKGFGLALPTSEPMSVGISLQVLDYQSIKYAYLLSKINYHDLI